MPEHSRSAARSPSRRWPRTRRISTVPCAIEVRRDGRRRVCGSLVTPWPQPAGERDKEARRGPPIFEPDACQGYGDRCVECEAVEIDSGACADRVQVLTSEVSETIEIVDAELIPESVAFDCRLLGADGNAVAVANFGLRAPAPIADQSAGIVAPPYRIIAAREFLEAQQRLPRILSLTSKRQGELWNRPEFAVSIGADHRRRWPALEPAGQDVVLVAIRAGDSAKAAGAEDIEALTQPKLAGETPARCLQRVAGIGEITAHGIE